jgi:hypothetical protein
MTIRCSWTIRLLAQLTSSLTIRGTRCRNSNVDQRFLASWSLCRSMFPTPFTNSVYGTVPQVSALNLSVDLFLLPVHKVCSKLLGHQRSPRRHSRNNRDSAKVCALSKVCHVVTGVLPGTGRSSWRSFGNLRRRNLVPSLSMTA